MSLLSILKILELIVESIEEFLFIVIILDFRKKIKKRIFKKYSLGKWFFGLKRK